jgi:hypothetical protein
MALLMPAVVAGTHVFRPTNSTAGISATPTQDTEPDGEESQYDAEGAAVSQEPTEVEDGNDEDDDSGRDIPHSQVKSYFFPDSRPSNIALL